MSCGRIAGTKKAVDIVTFVLRNITIVSRNSVKTSGPLRHGLGGNQKVTIGRNLR